MADGPKTSLGIWALGPLPSRFLPAGYRPDAADETTPERVRRAVAELGDLIDGYEFHHPQELNEQNAGEVSDALGGHDVYCLVSGLPADPRFARGGLVSPDAEIRREAVRRLLDAADLAGRLGAHLVLWPVAEGYDLPFETSYRRSWEWLLEAAGEAAQRCREHGVLLFLRHRRAEVAAHVLVRDVGAALHVAHALRGEGLGNVRVDFDWEEVVASGESLAERAAVLAAEGLLGHQHAGAGGGGLDGQGLVGATAFMETLELAIELRRAGYGHAGERLGFDLRPRTQDPIASIRRSVLQWRAIEAVAARLDGDALDEAQLRRDAIRAYELVYEALGVG